MLLATIHGIVIDHAIGAPGHGNDKVDGLNAVDKRFISEKKVLIITPEPNESSHQIHAAARVDGASLSIAAEAAHMTKGHVSHDSLLGEITRRREVIELVEEEDDMMDC
jgi:hypothetical protein